MHKTLNGKELMYISIEWLHDLNAIFFKSHWIESDIVGEDVCSCFQQWNFYI
jgi:hypothetical protein